MRVANSPGSTRIARVKKVGKEPQVITRCGKAVSVILPIKDYQKLLDRLENAEDAACLKKTRSKPLSFRPMSDYLAERTRPRV